MSLDSRTAVAHPGDVDRTAEFKNRGARYRLIEPAGELFHAELHVAELGGLEGFVKLFTVCRVRPELCKVKGAVELLLEDLNSVSKLSVWSINQVMDIWWGDAAITFSAEHVKGTTLAGAMAAAAARGERLPYTSVLATLLEVAQALEHAHEPLYASTPVVHGDLRPEHVLISKDGGVKLGGFGFARFLPLVSPDGAWCTWQGQCYQPPERLGGAAEDQRSDVYALGAVLLHAATGTLPYGTDNPERLLSLMRSEASALPAGSIGIPRDLLDVLARACSPRTQDRYDTVSDMARDLHSLLLDRARKDPKAPRVDGILRAVEAARREESSPAVPVLEATPASSVQAFPELKRPDTPLVGRGDAMLRIGRALASVAQGKGRAVLLLGEPGMGRTRLLTEVALRLSRSDRKLAWVHLEPLPDEREVGYSAVLRLLGSAIGLGPDVELIQIAEEADRLRAFGLDDQALAAVRGVAGLGEPPEPARVAGLLGQALRRCVTSLSWECTTVVACDDLQRVDDASLGCLRELLRDVSRVPVLVMLAATPGEDLSLPGELDTIELGPLNTEQCEELALALTPDATAVDPELLSVLVDRSDGNPLLMEELRDLLLEAGRLQIRQGTLSLDGGAQNPLPILEEAVRLRIASLFPEVASVAVAAALAGPALELEVLADATGVTEEVADRALEDLVDQHRVMRRKPAGLAFPHERLRSAVLASADPAVVVEMKQHLAAAILRRYPEPGCALADHTASLLAGCGDTAGAVEVLIAAAGRQAARGDPAGAAWRYHRALELVAVGASPDNREELDLCMETGRASLLALTLEIGEAALQRAVKLSDELGDALSGAEARVLLCRMLARRGRLKSARAWAVEAVPVAERCDDRMMLAGAYGAIAETLQQYGEYGPDWPYVEAAINIAREEGEHLRLGEFLQLAVMHAGGVGLYNQTSEFLEQARAIAEATDDPALSCQLLKAEALLLFFIGDAEAALETNLRGIREARRHGLVEVEIVMLHNAGDDHLELGNMQEALYYFTESMNRSRDACFDRLTEANEMFVGFIEASYLGARDGFDRLQGAIDSGRRLGRTWNLTQGHQLMGRALLAQGDRAGAVEHLEQAVASAEQTGVKFFTDEARRWLARAQAGTDPGQRP